jgi:hypothetical protein
VLEAVVPAVALEPHESSMNGPLTCRSGPIGYKRIMNATTRLLLFMALSLILAIAVPVIVTATTV